jgi:hypothetical protein
MEYGTIILRPETSYSTDLIRRFEEVLVLSEIGYRVRTLGYGTAWCQQVDDYGTIREQDSTDSLFVDRRHTIASQRSIIDLSTPQVLLLSTRQHHGRTSLQRKRSFWTQEEHVFLVRLYALGA